jgi:hypothetical protein
MAPVTRAIFACTARFLPAVFLALAPLPVVTVACAEELTFDLSIERGQVPARMRLVRVKQGDVVKLRWSSDRPIALHLHGYDVEQKVEPGAVAEMTFTARATGRFSVQEHKPHASGGHSHGSTIVQIEVLPR